MTTEPAVRANAVNIGVVCDDAITCGADVLAVKYAQGFYGVDAAVALALGIDRDAKMPSPGSHVLLPGNELVGASYVLFVGVEPLRQFGYHEIRQFARTALRVVSQRVPKAQTVAMTLHGPGFGLDETECFLAEVGGMMDALTATDKSPNLRSVLVVEHDGRRARRLDALLVRHLPTRRLDTAGVSSSVEAWDAPLNAGHDSRRKPRVFVAMPFDDASYDLFHYGIRQAVNNHGYLCERIDEVPMTGDILAEIKARIRTASLIIADVSDSNPNVYLEVGYAWGVDKPTVLLAHKSKVDTLKFDVKTQRCVVYSSIRDLEQRLSAEIGGLKVSLGADAP
jgi:hypothetical protein